MNLVAMFELGYDGYPEVGRNRIALRLLSFFGLLLVTLVESNCGT